MNWRIKAKLQGIVAGLPEMLSQPVYYALQRRFGALKEINPMRYLENAARLLMLLQRCGFKLEGKEVFELGTGRTVSTPIGMWLCGARSITTVDLNR